MRVGTHTFTTIHGAAMLFIVYDPQGEIFEVPAFRLNDLVVVRQWTFWHPSEKKDVFKDNSETTQDDGADQ